MAGAFQSNAFQNDAFQVDSAFTGGSGQAQCDIKQTYYGFGQANAQILATQHRLNAKYFDFTLRGQTWDHFWQDADEEDTTTIGYGSGQAQADIKQIYYGFGQAQCDIKIQGYGSGQAQCDTKVVGYGLGQANANILGAVQQFGQAQCDIKAVISSCGQAQCDVKTQGRGFGQAQCYIPVYAFGQAQCDIKVKGYGHGQVQCAIKALGNGLGQAQCYIPSDMTCLTDEFDRIVGTGWGTGNIGAWTSLGSNGDDSVDGTYGLDDWFDFGVADLFGSQIAHYTDIPAPAIGQDVWEEQIDFLWADATGGTPNFRIMTLDWATSVGFEQALGVELDALNSTIGAYWYNEVDGADDPQSITVDLAAIGHLKIRYDSVNQIFSAKYWENSDSEPAFQSTVGSVGNDLGSTPILVVEHNSLQTAPSGLTTSTPLKVDTLQFCYGGAVGITAGYGQAQALICATLLLDTFSRTFTGEPTSPDIGPDYVVGIFNDVSNLSADGDNLILTGDSDYDDYTIYNPVYLVDGESSLDFNLDEIRNWALVFNFTNRLPNASVTNPYIQFYGYYDPDATEFQIWFAGNDNIATHAVITVATETWYTAKFQFIGTQLKGKVWARDDEEPDWQLEDTTSNVDAGVAQWYADVGQDGTYPATQLYDNFQICSISSPPKNAYGQAQASIRREAFGQGQAECDIKAVRNSSGQAQCLVGHFGFGQAQARITGHPIKCAQANALILKWAGYGQAMAGISLGTRGYGQALCTVNRYLQTAQVQAFINHNRGYSQAQCFINAKLKSGQAQCYIITFRGNAIGQATCLVNNSIKQGWGQAQAYIFNRMTGQAQARIQKIAVKSGQASGYIQIILVGIGQAQATIHTGLRGSGQAQCLVNIRLGTGQAQCLIAAWGFAQAEAFIATPGKGYGQAFAEIGSKSSGQAQAIIRPMNRKYGQAQCFITKSKGYGQSQCWIKKTATQGYGQAQCMLRSKAVLAQAQCRIVLINMATTGQARVFINRNTHSGQAQAFITGSTYSPQYAVKYNGRFLPGYAQSEAYDSVMNTYKSEAAYMDLKFAEYTGLQNKVISLRFKAWTNHDFNDSKQDAQLAATIVRSNRAGFVPLYIQSMDKHYLALTKKFATNNDIKATHTYDYEVEFECKPWLITDQTESISGTGLIDTGSRALENGGWTPARVTITGTDVTVSGYTEAGYFTGFISVSGVVTNLEINSEAYTAQIAGVNKNEIMNMEYALYIGPGKTFFEVDGGTVTIEWEDRHYL